LVEELRNSAVILSDYIG